MAESDLNYNGMHGTQESPPVNTESVQQGNINWPQFLGFISLFIGAGIIAGLILGLFFGIYEMFTDIDLLFIFEGHYSLIFDAFIFAVVFFSFRPVRQFTLQAFDFSVLRYAKTYILMGASLIVFFISQYLIIGLWKIDDASGQSSDLGFDQVINQGGNNGIEIWLLLLSIAVLTPIKEEMIYRGIIHRFLDQRYHFWVGLIVSSLIFGMLHLGTEVSAVFMGIILVLLYRLTRSLVPSILLHMVWNLFVSLSFISVMV
jgi:membrane protease YdiL (CAAX protease family)